MVYKLPPNKLNEIFYIISQKKKKKIIIIIIYIAYISFII